MNVDDGDERFSDSPVTLNPVSPLQSRNQPKTNEKLSYRKQIARKLCTKYIEGICSNSVTLKFRFSVTRGH